MAREARPPSPGPRPNAVSTWAEVRVSRQCPGGWPAGRGWPLWLAGRGPGAPVVLVLVLRVQWRVDARPAVDLLLPGALCPALRVALQDIHLVDEGPARL